MSPAACANWSNVFVSGKVNATPFGMHVKIAHPAAGRLLTWCAFPGNECKQHIQLYWWHEGIRSMCDGRAAQQAQLKSKKEGSEQGECWGGVP